MASLTFLSNLFPISALLLSMLLLGNCYNFSCVVDRSDSQLNFTPFGGNIYDGGLWPNGVVTFRLHESILETGDDEVEEAYKAMTEIASKTCITFEEWEEGDDNFVDLMVDDGECGRAHLCMVGGQQWAKFGSGCRKMSTMVHELGHTLCLRHEHERSDRDDYLEFEGCSEKPDIHPENTELGIYDYASQMHYFCNTCAAGSPTMTSVTNCGNQVTSGLSIIDADSINALYDCQGCYRHRWRPNEHLTSEDVSNMHSFEYEDSVGKISPCRGLINGEITVGKYNWENEICSLSFGGEEYQFKNRFEVLTIPGGVNITGATYKLVDRENVESASIIEIAVPAGREAESGNVQTGYIAYVTVKIEGGGQEDSIGKVWVRDGVLTEALFVSEGKEYYVEKEYHVLTCS